MNENDFRVPDIEASQEGEDTLAPSEPASVEEELKRLREENARLQSENKSLQDQLLRRQAEFQNFRKRLEREQQEFRQSAQAGLVADLLPVLDAFERALSHAPESADDEYHKGIELIHKNLLDTLTAAGLEPIEAAGKPFDPFNHHAVERVETTGYPDHQVIAEMQRGYMFKQRLLRPALVRVAVHPGSSDSGEEAGD